MAVKVLAFFKVFVILILLNFSEGRATHSRHALVEAVSDETNDTRNGTIETNSTSEYLSSGVSSVQRMIKALPSASQIVHYGKQVLIGVPEEVASEAKRFLCSKIANLNDILKEYVPNADDLNFEYLTHDSDNVTIPLSGAEHLFNHPKFRMNWDLVLFVSGWNVNVTNETITALYDAYRCRGGYNFVVLNTSKYVNSMYAWSVLSTEPVGELIGEAIKNLTRFVPYESIHLIGDGIGAHIAGIAGRYFTRMTGKALPRITGLDPSRPCFSESDRPNGLQRGDALFVDIIHSNIEMWGQDPIGDVDFYPNGPNIIQPGCWSTSCRRNRSYQFYAKTVYPGMEYLFGATKCESFQLLRTGKCNDNATTPMGLTTPSWARGTFFLKSSIPDLSVPSKKHCYE